MDGGARSDRICVVCMKDIPSEANFCPNCGHGYLAEGGFEMGRKVGSVLPIIGGLSVLVVGILDIASGFTNLGNFFTYSGPSDSVDVLRLNALAGVVLLATGILAMISGWLASARRNFVLSLAGGIAALGLIGIIWGTGVHAFAGTSLALVGVILIALARDEFVD